LGATTAQAEELTLGNLKIIEPWARATPNGASVGAGYLTITNTGSEPDRLLGGTTAVAGSFEVHEMKMDNGVMKMRPVAGGIEIKPGQTVELKPNGYHIMLMGLKRPLVEGQHFQATLDFAKAGKITADFLIEGVGAQGRTSSIPPMDSTAGGKSSAGMKDMNMKDMKMK
jgi:copper(I)-binding protein